ncbi:MAG TPA: DUF4406 domain-containing protein, partial [Polyangiales bacterium]|nr:DUF4406 domain-containing protein [Polyangiales bacterium]
GRCGVKVVYLCHPLAGEIEQNRRNAARWVAWATLHMGVAIVADWITLTGELSEEHRELGLACDLALVERCDECWLVGGRTSPGMALEAQHARDQGVLVRDLTHLGFACPTGPTELPEAA